MFDDAAWDVAFDERFLSTLRELDRSSGELKDNVSKTVEAIVENPLKGDPKTGKLRGYRTTHIEHLVVVWELEPEIISVHHLDQLVEVYFHDVKHHDKMREAVGSKSPVEITKHFTVTFDSYEVQSIISQLYDCDGIEVLDQNWDENGVTIVGSLTEDYMDQLYTVLPESATIELAEAPIP